MAADTGGHGVGGAVAVDGDKVVFLLHPGEFARGQLVIGDETVEPVSRKGYVHARFPEVEFGVFLHIALDQLAG